jgi:hypothetical protein
MMCLIRVLYAGYRLYSRGCARRPPYLCPVDLAKVFLQRQALLPSNIGLC